MSCECNNELETAEVFMAKKKIEDVEEKTAVGLLLEALGVIDAEQAELTPDSQKHADYRNCRSRLQATIAHIKARLY